MYSIKLDENNYFTGSYAKVGSVPGGMSINSLPPDLTKGTCYKYEKVTSIENVPTIKIDPETDLPVLDEEGNEVYEYVPTEVSRMDWVFDEEKYNLENNLKQIEEIRIQREKAFELIDRYQLVLVYQELTDEQKEELKIYRQSWLDAPETRSIPKEPDWFKL